MSRKPTLKLESLQRDNDALSMQSACLGKLTGRFKRGSGVNDESQARVCGNPTRQSRWRERGGERGRERERQ